MQDTADDSGTLGAPAREASSTSTRPVDLPDCSVFVPAHPAVGEGPNAVRFEPRYLGDGRLSLLAFTTVEHLVEQLGEAQPWLWMHTDRLWEFAESIGVTTVCLDPVVTETSGRWTEDDLRELWGEPE